MQKKIITALLGLALCAPAVMAIDNIQPATDGSFYDSAALQSLRTAYQAADKAAAGVQFDTTRAGTNTDTTLFTPRFIGDLLVGMNGTTNKLFMATDLTVDGWVQVLP